METDSLLGRTRQQQQQQQQHHVMPIPTLHTAMIMQPPLVMIAPPAPPPPQRPPSPSQPQPQPSSGITNRMIPTTPLVQRWQSTHLSNQDALLITQPCGKQSLALNLDKFGTHLPSGLHDPFGLYIGLPNDYNTLLHPSSNNQSNIQLDDSPIDQRHSYNIIRRKNALSSLIVIEMFYCALMMASILEVSEMMIVLIVVLLIDCIGFFSLIRSSIPLVNLFITLNLLSITIIIALRLYTPLLALRIFVTGLSFRVRNEMLNGSW
ncbi:hypothetical protein SAMD00019534_121620 [Acytostelium subglobosum LB1]|uniref:hypothetical protein n=1 Tax=Acytostelium subglobosum LB1 TaxID=1410327 RepID=UPI000644BBFE|nr:hypothetical protein SAMD00019534_121620 [Acytostelium subglobosum LB1]GAM28986.1 hypothetical protein SAMD00019534_121620 [Acytostelium subglobosum LB1]|eukprot:XP_012747992.1 hypothetical protein SAMD00019534_121620 [Acytostelium subglobosum LB1]